MVPHDTMELTGPRMQSRRRRWAASHEIHALSMAVAVRPELRGHNLEQEIRAEMEGNDRFLPNADEAVSSRIGTRDDVVSSLVSLFFSSLSIINLLPHQQIA